MGRGGKASKAKLSARKPEDSGTGVAMQTAEVDPKALAAFLATAPTELRTWADEQLTRYGAGLALTEAEDDEDAVGLEAFEDEDEHPRAAKKPAPAKTSGKSSKNSSVLGVHKVNLVLVVLLAAAIVIIVQQYGAHPDLSNVTSNPSSSLMPTDLGTIGQVDQQQVDILKAKAEAEPENPDVRYEIGELYLAAKLDQEAITWYEQALAINPDHLEALLAIGVAEFNIELDAQAEAHWTHATEVAPDAPEPWFNLGFLYMAVEPPQTDKAEAAWNKVVELAPGSDLAQTAQSHLDRMRSQASGMPTEG